MPRQYKELCSKYKCKVKVYPKAVKCIYVYCSQFAKGKPIEQLTAAG